MGRRLPARSTGRGHGSAAAAVGRLRPSGDSHRRRSIDTRTTTATAEGGLCRRTRMAAIRLMRTQWRRRVPRGLVAQQQWDVPSHQR